MIQNVIFKKKKIRKESLNKTTKFKRNYYIRIFVIFGSMQIRWRNSVSTTSNVVLRVFGSKLACATCKILVTIHFIDKSNKETSFY